MPAPEPLVLRTQHETLRFDPASGCLLSLQSDLAPGQEFIAAGPADPAFIVQYLDLERRFRQLSSRQAAAVAVHVQQQGNANTLTARYERVGGLDLDVTITVRAAPAERCSRWSLAVRNGAGLAITDVQFPFIVCPYHLAGQPGSEALLWPFYAGQLINAPRPQDLWPDHPHSWQLRPENGDFVHYPGFITSQFLAYYNDRAGLYLAAQDSAGYLKLIRPVHHGQGLRLGFAHVGDWPQGERTLEYDMVLTTFAGDWYAAADLYREWSLQQPWACTPLSARTDVPGWLKDSPPHVVVRIQGQLDIGPAEPNAEFLPYRKIVPLMEQVSGRLNSPVVPVIMSWERPGPWVYPDCFPVAGGNEALWEFCTLARARSWHIGTFCNGTRWVTGHFWSGYDGEDDFRRRQGADTVCRTAEGELWRENWDGTWRPSYACCLGLPRTRQIARDFVRTITDLGLDWVQFFDQNCGSAAFPCYAPDHGHPALPGRWMPQSMHQILNEMHTLFEEQAAASGGERQFVLSVEGPTNETDLQAYQVCDIRVTPPGHRYGTPGFVPLYHYLYHEFIVIQGGFGQGPEPYHMPIRTAANLVWGQIPGAVLTGDGRLLNYDTGNWAPWEPYVGSNEDALASLAAATALRQGPAKDYLVFGRMLSPGKLEGVPIVRWQENGKDHAIPAVFHAVWRSPAGNTGWVLANWTAGAQTVRLVDRRLSGTVRERAGGSAQVTPRNVVDGTIEVQVPPLGCVLVEKGDS